MSLLIKPLESNRMSGGCPRSLFYAYKRYVEHRQTNGQPGEGRTSVNVADRQQHITKQLRRLSGKQHQALAHDLQVDSCSLQYSAVHT